MRISISISDDHAQFDFESLDRVDKKTIKSIEDPVAFKAVASVEWKDKTSRENCRKYQEDRSGNRWKKVEDYSKRMRAGEIPKIGTVFLLADARNETLVPVDGARRLMAFCEARIRKVDVVVIMSMQQN